MPEGTPPVSNGSKGSKKDAEGQEPAAETTPLVENNDEVDPMHRTLTQDEVCCCCICQCSREETRFLSCCGCFPIKCGIVATGILTLLLILSSFIEIFYFILNDYIHWWFVLVAVLLLIPAIIGACFLVTFFN